MTLDNPSPRSKTGEATGLPDGIPPLLSFYLYLTTGCNLCCRHCWIAPEFVTEGSSRGRFLDLALLRAAVAEAKPLGLQGAKLTGGEPLLHPRFGEIVDFLTARGLWMDLETNGTLITPELAAYLKQGTNVRFISISLDAAVPADHDAFRGVAGAFDAAIRGLANLVRVGYPPQVIMSPYRGNVNQVDDLVDLAVRLGAGSVKFNPVASSGRGRALHERGDALSYTETMQLVRHIRDELRPRSPIPLQIVIPPALSAARDLLQHDSAGGTCRVAAVLGILGTGEMALCGVGRSVPELTFGVLGRHSLRDTWISHPTLVELRRRLGGDYPGICGDCIHSRRCMTQCVAMNYLASGHLVWPAALCAEAERRGEFPASRRRSQARLRTSS